jgi:hypothetical protein
MFIAKEFAEFWKKKVPFDAFDLTHNFITFLVLILRIVNWRIGGEFINI